MCIQKDAPNVHCSTVYNSQDMETTWTPTGGGMDKDDVVHFYTMERYSATENNEMMPSAATRMDLETVILSEATLTEKKKYHMKFLTWIQKEMIQMNFTKQKQTHKLKEKFMVASGVRMG